MHGQENIKKKLLLLIFQLVGSTTKLSKCQQICKCKVKIVFVHALKAYRGEKYSSSHI